MLLHGLLWTSWIDEYLKWDPSKYNNTRRIAIESWKIWQPALSLYNSARGNSWYLYMSGLPASVNNDGKVWASGSFSFHVTCLFDFTNYPYDEQECPIVIADWIYDLSKVNLSDPSGNTGLNKPTIKLSYDPLDNTNTKRYVAGCWEVKDTWRRQCYWGPTGCKDEPPDSQPEWFWSLIEFGIRIKRNVPYFGLTFILPTIITCFLTLIVFWIDTMSLAITTAVMNILLQGLYSWEFIKNLPPGSGGIPKIVSFYGMNLSLTGIAFILHVIITYLIYILPENLELPFQLLTGDYQNEEYHQQDQQKLQRYDNVIAMDQNPILPSITTTGSELELSPAIND
ncbi:Acetylcholine receptor-like protein cup-4, partial [Dirofilaria immitis]|nr:Acetylcholine receptor-like protein cup-4 [Dirofilaria immitis]